MITGPADDVAPPWMSDLVRGDVAPERVCAALGSQQLRALSSVDKRQVRHVDQRGPRLTEKPCWLLGHRDSRVRKSAEEDVIDPHGVFCVGNCGIGHGSCGNHTQRSASLDALTLETLDVVLDLSQLIRHFGIGIKLDVVSRIFIGYFFALETSIIESCDSQFCFPAGPLRDRYVAVT